MGIKMCDRKGCTNIMCDRYNEEYGYICDECFEELIHAGVGIHIILKEFFNNEKSFKCYDKLTRKAFEKFFKTT